MWGVGMSTACGHACTRYEVYKVRAIYWHFQTCYLNYIVSSSPGILISSRRCIVYGSSTIISVVDALFMAQVPLSLVVDAPYTAQSASYPVINALSTAQVPSFSVVDALSTSQVSSSPVADALSNSQVPSSPVIDALSNV